MVFLCPLGQLVARPVCHVTTPAGSPMGTMPWRFRASRNRSSCSSACAAGAVEMASPTATAIADRAANTRWVLLLLARMRPTIPRGARAGVSIALLVLSCRCKRELRIAGGRLRHKMTEASGLIQLRIRRRYTAAQRQPGWQKPNPDRGHRADLISVRAKRRILGGDDRGAETANGHRRDLSTATLCRQPFARIPRTWSMPWSRVLSVQ